MRQSLVIQAALCGMLLCCRADAHHSYAMFDTEKTFTMVGTVKEFQFTNPHVWLRVMIEKDGKLAEWDVEGTSPNTLFRHGWTPKSLSPGDKITVVFHPLKDGTDGGSLISVTTSTGEQLNASG